MIKKLLSIFSGKSSSPEEKKPGTPTVAAPKAEKFEKSEQEKKPTRPVNAEKSLKDILAFVDYVVRALVDNPTAVKIELVEDEKGQVININCEKEDIGKIIGKSGKTIMAIRSLVAGAGSRLNRQMSVEVIDQVAS